MNTLIIFLLKKYKTVKSKLSTQARMAYYKCIFYGFCFNTSFKDILKEISKIGFKKLRYPFLVPLNKLQNIFMLFGLYGYLGIIYQSWIFGFMFFSK
jgi:hypothetical protein